MRRKSGFPFFFCYIAIPTGLKDGLPLRNHNWTTSNPSFVDLTLTEL